jgi:hypothetical protein
MGGIGITVFEDSNYRGDNATFRDDVPDLGAYRLARRISSLRIAPGETWEVCEATNYAGRCQVFSGVEPDLKRRNWNDKVSSLRRIRGGGPGPGAYRITLYAEENYRGQAREITVATPSLGSFNDRARSVRVISGTWELCEDSSYRDCRTVDRDWPNLAGLGLSRRVSSARPVGGGGGVYPPRPPIGRARLVLYDRTGYRGASRPLDNDAGTLGDFGNRAESAQVIGTWELCDGVNFTGRCVVLTGNTPDLASYGLKNRVSSARRVGPQPR